MALMLFLVVGMVAQFVDGALGMAFGITSTSLLLLLGSAPAAAAASVHMAEMGTTLASGLAHWRAGNVDRRLLVLLRVPGAAGAFLGAYVLSGLDLTGARPLTSGLLLLLGFFLLYRSVRPQVQNRVASRGRFAYPALGVGAGFVDAAGGGGWGPVATPTLLLAGFEPRRTVGTVSAAEFLVSVAASVGSLVHAPSGVDARVVIGLLIGGVLIAPVAARLASRLDPLRFLRLIGTAVVWVNIHGLLMAGTDWPAWLPVVAATAVSAAAYAVTRSAARKRAGDVPQGGSRDESPAGPSAGAPAASAAPRTRDARRRRDDPPA